MRIKATSAGKKVDLRDACSKITLGAASEDEALFLAVLHNTIIAGGKIVVYPGKKARKLNKYVKGKIGLEYTGE